MENGQGREDELGRWGGGKCAERWRFDLGGIRRCENIGNCVGKSGMERFGGERWLSASFELISRGNFEILVEE